MEKRRMIGVTLMAASVIAAILLQAFTGRVLMFRSIGPAHVVSTRPLAIETTEVIELHWRYDIPLAAGFVTGLIYFAWPTRKPPRLSRDGSTTS